MFSQDKKILDVLDHDYFKYIKDYFYNHDVVKGAEYSYYGSKRCTSFDDPVLKELLQRLLPNAREWFGKDDIVPSYAVFSDYGDSGFVDSHVDSGACSYTIDLCLYENSEWPLFVGNNKYILKENEAIIFSANYQEHGRDKMTGENNRVGIVLLHYVDPDHVFLRLPEKIQKSFIPKGRREDGLWI